MLLNEFKRGMLVRYAAISAIAIKGEILEVLGIDELIIGNLNTWAPRLKCYMSVKAYKVVPIRTQLY